MATRDSTLPYTISAYARYLSNLYQALLDRGANGPILGKDVRIIKFYEHRVSLNGVDDHTVRDLRLAQAGAFAETQRGPIILIFDHGAHMPDGRTIISPAQLEHFGWKIFDRAPAITGIHPYIESTEGYRLPLESRDALLYLKLRPFTDDEWKSLPHILASSPHPWDPSCLDARVPDDWFSQQPPTSPYQLASDYDEFGDLKPGRPLAL